MAESETLLLVMPDLRRRARYADVLRRGGFRVLQAPTAGIALTRCEREKPGVVITDIVLPGMPGVDIARALRACAADEQTVIIGLLPRCFADREADARALQFDCLLHEPIAPEVLVRGVHEVCAVATRGRTTRWRPPADPIIYAS